MLDFKQAIVVDIIDETYNTKRFFLQLPLAENFNFEPGQFITLDLPISDKKAKRLRSYSIASAPNANNILELVIVLLTGGLGTTYLFNEIKVGSEINFRGPLGHFVLPKEMPKDLFLICTGTGIAPFRSMVQHLKNTNLPIGNITLIYGTRLQKDILYYQEFTDLENELAGFKYIPVLSRELEWHGAKGYVHEQYLKLCEAKPDAQFMLCGWRAMIDEARENLKNLGYGKLNIHFELYG